MTGTHLLLVNILFGTRQLTNPNYQRIVQSHSVEQVSVGSQRVRQNQGIATVVFRAGDGVPVPEAVHLLGIQ